MADNAVTNCLNGELKPGDLVLSTPVCDYACLVGTVLSIDKASTPDHGDAIHVNFRDAEYSEKRLLEVTEMLGDLYGRPTLSGTFPPIDIDDVVMAPDMLFRITGFTPDLMRVVLGSREGAELLCHTAEHLYLPPAGKEAAQSSEDLERELHARLDKNLSDYCESMMDVDKRELIGLSEDIAARYAVRHYLKNDYEFRPGEVEYLLRFSDPLGFVADRWPSLLDGLVDMRDVMSDILQYDESVQHLAVLPDMRPFRQSAPSSHNSASAAPENDIQQQKLFNRLEQNFWDNIEELHAKIADPGSEFDGIIKTAKQITANDAAYRFLTMGYDFREGDVETLLRHDSPLSAVAAEWPVSTAVLVVMEASVHDAIDAVSKELPDTLKGVPAGAEEKPSVLEQLRQAAKELKPPRKEPAQRGHDGPER